MSRLRGRPPYGYRTLAQAEGPHPARSVVPDERAAPVVRRIFGEYLAGRGLSAIAEQLTADGVPSPRAVAPGAEPETVAWSKSAVRTILVNPRYAGFTTQASCAGPGQRPEPIVPVAEVERVRQMFASRKAGTSCGVSARPRRYLLQGLVRCARCNRLMDGTVNNGEPYYRCRIPAAYAAANKIDHPRNVYLRESIAVELLYRWLTSACAPRRLLRLEVPGLAEPDRVMTIEATAHRLRALKGSPPEQFAALQALGLRSSYSDADRTLHVKTVLEPAGMVARASLNIWPTRERKSRW